MVAVCIEQRNTRVRRGCAGDAGSIVKHLRRGTRVPLLDPKGPALKGLGRRPAPLAMPPASPRDTILAQPLESGVQIITIAQTGSSSFRER